MNRSLVEELYTIDGKAEIYNGQIVMDAPTGGLPGLASARIFQRLDAYANDTGLGRALPDNVGFIVDLPHRQSFSPDAAFYLGELTMRFLEGAPIFAVEVRSERDYGDLAEARMKRKRADYFAAGTMVVWDVDLLGDDVISVYRFDSPDLPVYYRKGEEAEAEPALPGWRMSVDEVFA